MKDTRVTRIDRIEEIIEIKDTERSYDRGFVWVSNWRVSNA